MIAFAKKRSPCRLRQSRDKKEKSPVAHRAFPVLSPVKASCAKKSLTTANGQRGKTEAPHISRDGLPSRCGKKVTSKGAGTRWPGSPDKRCDDFPPSSPGSPPYGTQKAPAPRDRGFFLSADNAGPKRRNRGALVGMQAARCKFQGCGSSRSVVFGGLGLPAGGAAPNMVGAATGASAPKSDFGDAAAAGCCCASAIAFEMSESGSFTRVTRQPDPVSSRSAVILGPSGERGFRKSTRNSVGLSKKS
jgi:hypothetical protein